MRCGLSGDFFYITNYSVMLCALRYLKMLNASLLIVVKVWKAEIMAEEKDGKYLYAIIWHFLNENVIWITPRINPVIPSKHISTGVSALLPAPILRAAAAWGGQQDAEQRPNEQKDAIDLPSTHLSCDAHAHIALRSFVKSLHDLSLVHGANHSKA